MKYFIYLSIKNIVETFRTFGFDDPCESVHFEKIRLLFHKVENDICIAMVIIIIE
jgi:hypothetical protein